MSSKDSPNDEANQTLVGARPIKMLEARKRKRKKAKEEDLPSPTPIPLRVDPEEAEVRFEPEPPRSIEATSIPPAFLEDLCLKHLFQAGELRGGEISRLVCLPPIVVEELMERLKKALFVDIKGTRGVGIGRTQTIFKLTEAGQSQAIRALERDQYVGAAPVAFSAYCEAVKAQSIRKNRLSQNDIEEHFAELVFKGELFETIGPALNSGRSLFVYGPAGNGKTALCQRITRCFGTDVFIPKAIMLDSLVIKIYDETVHQEVEMTDEDSLWDERWIRCQRPMVAVGGDLILGDLELRYSPELKYYEAPFQLKANCGVLLIDDLGRQRVSPKDLLNRWIVPLENEIDFLMAHTGKKICVPFDVFVIFSTNLDPASLVDDAFLRRVRYKIEVPRPDEARYTEIFKAECQRQGVEFDERMLDHLIKAHYQSVKRPFNACEPRDLLEQVVDVCTYRGIEPLLSKDIIDRVASNYFVKF